MTARSLCLTTLESARLLHNVPVPARRSLQTHIEGLEERLMACFDALERLLQEQR
jgi:hypothetical protein